MLGIRESITGLLLRTAKSCFHGAVLEQLCRKFKQPLETGIERERTFVNPMTSNPMIESYFAALVTQLSDLPQTKRDDVVRELRAHVFDRLEQITVPTDDDCRTGIEGHGHPGGDCATVPVGAAPEPVRVEDFSLDECCEPFFAGR